MSPPDLRAYLALKEERRRARIATVALVLVCAALGAAGVVAFCIKLWRTL